VQGDKYPVNGLCNQPQDKLININGLKLHYLDWENPQRPTVLMLHGFANCAATWIPIACPLAAARRHVVALDLRGHGDSQWTDQDKYRMADLVSDIAFFLDALDIDKVTLVGHSMGGAVSQYFTAEYPGKVDRLVIVDNGPEFGEKVLERRINHNVHTKRFFSGLHEVAEYLAKLDPFSPMQLLLEEAEHLTKTTEFEKLTWKFHALNSGSAAISSESALSERWEILGLITCPTLILRGAESGHLVRDVAEEMVRTIPRAELIEVENAGHFIHRNNPERFKEVLGAFLNIEDNTVQ